MHIERYVTFLAANDLLLAILNLAALGGVLFAVIRSIMWVYRFVRDWWHSSLRSTWRAFKLRLARHSVLCADSPTYYLATVTSGLAALILALAGMAMIPIVAAKPKLDPVFPVEMKYFYGFGLIVFTFTVLLFVNVLIEQAKAVREVVRRRIRRQRRGG